MQTSAFLPWNIILNILVLRIQIRDPVSIAFFDYLFGLSRSSTLLCRERVPQQSIYLRG
jgi:hypothetical protein